MSEHFVAKVTLSKAWARCAFPFATHQWARGGAGIHHVRVARGQKPETVLWGHISE